MTSLNQVVLTGRIATPPRRHYRPDGLPVIQFPLEIYDSDDRKDKPQHHPGAGPTLNRVGTGRTGQNRITIVAVGKLAELDLELLQIGQSLMVTGKLHLRSWQTPEGKSRTQTEIIASDLRRIEANSQIPGPEK